MIMIDLGTGKLPTGALHRLWWVFLRRLSEMNASLHSPIKWDTDRLRKENAQKSDGKATETREGSNKEGKEEEEEERGVNHLSESIHHIHSLLYKSERMSKWPAGKRKKER